MNSCVIYAILIMTHHVTTFTNHFNAKSEPKNREISEGFLSGYVDNDSFSSLPQNITAKYLDVSITPEIKVETTTIRKSTLDVTTAISTEVTTDIKITTETIATTVDLQEDTPKASVSPENSTCHLECIDRIERSTFSVIPNVTLLKAGKSLTLECSLSEHENSFGGIIWFFQATNPLKNQCSLIPQESWTPCESFTSVDHIVDDNITSGYIKETLILHDLTERNSGYFYCMVSLFCCSNSYTMERVSGMETPITIFYEDYILELKVMISLTFILLVIIGVAVTFESRRRRKNAYKNILICHTTMSDVLHAPILEADDSFDESDQDES